MILEVLAEYAEKGQSEIEAESLLQQIRTKKFIFLLVLFKELFSKSDFATKGLQSVNIAVSDTVDLIETLKQAFTDMRSGDSAFTKMLEKTNTIMAENDIDSWDTLAVRPRSRKLPERLEGSVVLTSLGKSKRVRCDADLRAICNELMDCQLNELNTRFHSDTYGLMECVHLMSTRQVAGDFASVVERLNEVGKRFHVTLTEAELTVFVQMKQRAFDRGNSFKSLLEVLDICNEEVFPNIHAFLRAMITLPMTSCTVERVFSSVKRIKTANRSTMLTSRLRSLCLLTFERELTVTLDYDEIIDIFKTKPRRLHL